MNAGAAGQLAVVAEVARRLGLASLQPAVRACEALSGDEPIDVAVLGQFKSGKSSFLNAVLREALFPVGALPVTAVITRAVPGSQLVARVTHLDGSAEEIAPARLSEFVTEAGNPGNRRQVAVVDVFTPAMRDWPGVRLVDTPGLGSVFAHNTETTRTWMPNVAVALVTVSADRPLSDEDRRLVAEARKTAPRVVVVLTKVDLLTDAERAEVAEFLDRTLRESFHAAIPVLPFSSRVEPERWVHLFRQSVLRPVTANVADERRAALALKLVAVARACHGYVTLGLQAAERADAERDRLRAAVFDETVNVDVLRDELRLAAERVCAETRPAFERLFLDQRVEVEQRVTEALAAELGTWHGNLTTQARRYEAWMTQRLTTELRSLSEDATPCATGLLVRAERRFRRIVEAFRDRLGENIQQATGITVSPIAWEVKRSVLAVVPVALSQTFMTDWELLCWLLPMRLVGGLFRRHVVKRVPWEVEKNLIRLAGDWAGTVDTAVADLRTQAEAWVDAELNTLGRLLGQRPTEGTAFRDALERLEESVVLQLT
jgi:GTP-binding protein EngB required for normal cell division